MFRALTKDGKEVFGWLLKAFGIFKIIDNENNCYPILPETVAMKTGQADKNGKMIYGSFGLDGFGMTSGGDIVQNDYERYNVLFGEYYLYWHSEKLVGFYFRGNRINSDIKSDVEIIGKQYENNKNIGD